MLLRIFSLAASIAFGALASGCACSSCQRVPATPVVPCAQEEGTADDSPPEISVSSDYELAPLPSPTETYRLLDAATTQCSAVTNDTIANMVELERHWAKVMLECDTKSVRKNLCLDRDLLALHAYDHRNMTAALALEAFHQLAGLEAQKHYLILAAEETGRTLDRLDRLKEQGLSTPDEFDRTDVAKQLNELETKKVEVDFLRIQLNGQLQKLTGCPLDETTFFWPQADWEPQLAPLDIEEELATGLATRADLRGLHLTLCNLTKTTLTVARGVLKFADSTVGSVEPQDGWIHVARCYRCNQHEVPVRRRQLALFVDHSEQSATAEIKGAAYRIGLLQQRVVIAQKIREEQQRRLDELRDTRDINDITIFEISSARGQLYEAESKLIEEVTALRIAYVQLRKTQGMLALECGFEPTLCTEGCCNGQDRRADCGDPVPSCDK